MYFTKTREVKSPVRANLNDAGMDFFIPSNLPEKSITMIDSSCSYTVTDGDVAVNMIRIDAGGRVLIPSGIHVRLQPGTALILMNKSGVAHKLGLIIGSCVVDESYTGEIHLSLINTTSKPVMIEAGQKIAQGIIFNMNYAIPTEVEGIDELYRDFETSRGAGGFGSSGEK